MRDRAARPDDRSYLLHQPLVQSYNFYRQITPNIDVFELKTVKYRLKAVA